LQERVSEYKIAGLAPMDHTQLDTLDQQILDEKKLVAREHFLNAWEAGLLDGIDTEIIAKELIVGALEQIGCSKGSDATLNLIAEITDMDLNGAFHPNKILH
jgi:hypothetical protein